MEYRYTDEEKFYLDLSSTVKELLYTDKFPISQEEKKKLWFQIYETAQRYEEHKGLHLDELSNKIGESFAKIGENMAYIFETAQNIIPELNRTRINSQIALAKIEDTNGTIKKILKEEHRLEARLTADLIIAQMKKRSNKN